MVPSVYCLTTLLLPCTVSTITLVLALIFFPQTSDIASRLAFPHLVLLLCSPFSTKQPEYSFKNRNLIMSLPFLKLFEGFLKLIIKPNFLSWPSSPTWAGACLMLQPHLVPLPVALCILAMPAFFLSIPFLILLLSFRTFGCLVPLACTVNCFSSSSSLSSISGTAGI